MAEAGIKEALVAAGQAYRVPGACPHCSTTHGFVIHGGPCPRVKAIEYHPNGAIKRVEFHAATDEEQKPTGGAS